MSNLNSVREMFLNTSSTSNTINNTTTVTAVPGCVNNARDIFKNSTNALTYDACNNYARNVGSPFFGLQIDDKNISTCWYTDQKTANINTLLQNFKPVISSDCTAYNGYTYGKKLSTAVYKTLNIANSNSNKVSSSISTSNVNKVSSSNVNKVSSSMSTSDVNKVSSFSVVNISPPHVDPKNGLQKQAVGSNNTVTLLQKSSSLNKPELLFDCVKTSNAIQCTLHL